MGKLKLAAESRKKAGRGLPALRAAGYVPGILYGKKKEPKMVKILSRDLVQATETEAGLNAIFDLSVDGKGAGLVRIREFQSHPLNRHFTHVDLQAVDLREKIEVEVPIRIVGKSEGVKMGGIMDQQRRVLLIQCLVNAIPEHIDIDVSQLSIGDSIHADDVPLPEGVAFPHETNFTVVAVVQPTKEEEPTPTVPEGEVPLVGEEAPAEGEAGEEAVAPSEDEKKEERKEKKEKK